MRHLLRRLWADDAGAVVSTELVMVMGVGVLGVGAGVKALRDAALSGFHRTADSVRAVAPDPEAARELVAPSAPRPAAASVSAVNSVEVNVFYQPRAARLEPPAP